MRPNDRDAPKRIYAIGEAKGDSVKPSAGDGDGNGNRWLTVFSGRLRGGLLCLLHG